MSGDNSRFDLDCMPLGLSLQVAWTQVYKAGVTHWMEVPRLPAPKDRRFTPPATKFNPDPKQVTLYTQPARLILFNGDPHCAGPVDMASYNLRQKRPDLTDPIMCEIHRFPGAIKTWEEAETTVRAWLKDQEYGPQPDHDGDNGRSWRVYNEAWNRVDVPGTWSAFVAIEPSWEMYGK